MTNLSFAIEVRNGGRGEDRAACFEAPDRHVFVVADGAGGVGGGGLAAERVVKAAEKFALGIFRTPLEALRSVEIELLAQGSMSTGVIVEVRAGRVSGASCGDSVAWMIAEGSITDLTELQVRKPLLGAGASPISFENFQFRGTLILASDGLVDYASRQTIVAASCTGTVVFAANTLAELSRLGSGSYQDDVAVILARANV